MLSDKQQQEHGYTLFLTILTITIFSILAVSLMSMTLSGTLRSEAREEVTQATELAEKGYQYLLQEIVTDLTEQVEEYPDGLTLAGYEKLLDDTLLKYECSHELDFTESVTGRYKACVDDFKPVDDGREVVIDSIGHAEDKSKQLFMTSLFPINALPDRMEYAVHTFVTDECRQSQSNCKLGEGNLYLHGGVGIQGDMNVRRHLITSNRSYEKYASHHWIHSYFPSALPKANGEPSSILLGEDIYTVTWPNLSGTYNSKFDYSNHISHIDMPPSSPYTKHDYVDESVFVGNYVAEKSKRMDYPKRETIDVTRVKDKYQYKQNDPGVTVLETNLFGTEGVDRVIRNGYYPNQKVFPKWYRNFSGKFWIRGYSTFKQFATQGNLALGNVLTNNVIEFIDGAYIEGNLEIGNDVHVKGPIYVNGDLIIDGNNLVLDSIFYVNGMVHIKHASFDTNISPNIKGEFIVYSNGKIVLERSNKFNDYPAVLNAFLFSNESIEMDGNESHLHIRGGLSAPRIVLNGIRGRSYSGANLFKQTEPQIIEGRAYEGYKEQARRDSRLKIIYDTSVIEKYADFLLDDRIYEVKQPHIIDIEEKDLNQP